MMNKTAMVFGCGRSRENVGAGIVNKLQEEGWEVIGVDTNISNSEQPDYFYQIDVRDRKQLEGLFEIIESKFESLDLVVNSVGVNKLGDLSNYTDEMWDETIDVNLKSQFLILQQYFKRYNDKNYQKRFIAITSHSGMIPKSSTFAYGASKAGADHFIRCAARELNKYHGGEDWVVVGFAAGMIQNTPMDLDIKKELIKKMDNVENMADAHKVLTKNIPTNRGLTIEEVGEWIYFIADKGSYSTGDIIMIDSGQVQG